MNSVPSFSWRVKEAALWFESYGSKNLTGGTTWSSQSTSTDWLTRTHHWSSPRSKLANKKPTSTRKLRKFPVTSGQGLKHRDWTASRWWARWRSQSSSCQHHVITWRGLIPADHEYLDSVAWPCHDCEVAPVWHHDVTNARTCQIFAVCLTVFPFEFRPRTFTIGFYGKNSIISELMILECSFPLICWSQIIKASIETILSCHVSRYQFLQVLSTVKSQIFVLHLISYFRTFEKSFFFDRLKTKKKFVRYYISHFFLKYELSESPGYLKSKEQDEKDVQWVWDKSEKSAKFNTGWKFMFVLRPLNFNVNLFWGPRKYEN